MAYILAIICIFSAVIPKITSQANSHVGRCEEVFAWKQISFDINGEIITRDTRDRVLANNRYIQNRDAVEDRSWNWNVVPSPTGGFPGRWATVSPPRRNFTTPRPSTENTDEEKWFYIKYNNVPMGMERVGDRLFVSLPRRRYGIPSSLNYVLLNETTSRSPPLRPYPDISKAADLVSVYRTRADRCNRLWMVDTGRLELPVNQRQIQPPAIVIFDLGTNRQLLRYDLPVSVLPAENTPTGLSSITVEVSDDDCDDAHAYINDLTTYGLIVYSFKDNSSWRHSHNFFSFNPVMSKLYVSNQRFQWSDGIFSITLLPGRDGCKMAYFHPLISTHEFAVSTCVLKNRTAMADPNYFDAFTIVGDRGELSQSTIHDYHLGTNVIFFSEISRDAVTCWSPRNMLMSTNVGVLCQDSQRMSYPSDLHVTGDELWVMANRLPRFGYSQLNTNDYNFFIYKADIPTLISGTVCARDYA